LRRRNLSMSVDISIKLRVNTAANSIIEFLLCAIQFVTAKEKSRYCKNKSYTIFANILQFLKKKTVSEFSEHRLPITIKCFRF
jgi:hypothetical protein